LEISLNRENTLSEKQLSLSNILPWLYGVLTCVLTLIFSYNNIQPWSTLFAILFGAFITYIVQDILQRDSEKRRINVDYVEKYYGPLLAEIQKIHNGVLINVGRNNDLRNLYNFRTQPQFYTMGDKLKTDYLSFNDEIGKLTDKIGFYDNKIIELIREKGNSFLMDWSNATFSSDHSYNPISLVYSYKGERASISLNNSILQEKNPVEIIKERVINFQEKGLQVEFYLDIKDEIGNINRVPDKKSYSERSKIIDEVFTYVRDNLYRDESYHDFKAELDNLRKKGESISSRLTEYIEKYVSIVNI
jgi:hypothetical protein